MLSQRQHKLDAVVAWLQLRYGPQAVGRAAALPPAPSPIATAFAGLDAILGDGGSCPGRSEGLPRGRISEIIGAPTSGKVTLAAKILAAAHQEPEALVAWLDLGRTCDPDYLHRCGLDLDRLLIVRPADGVDALAIMLHLVESDTLAALVFDGLMDLRQDMGRTGSGIGSRLAGTLERLATAVTRTGTAVIFLTEPQAEYRTLAHLATLRLAVRRERWIMQGPDVRGYESIVKVVKHRLRRAGAEAPIQITFDGTVKGDGML